MGLIILVLIMSLSQSVFGSSINILWQDKPLDLKNGPQIESGTIYIPVEAIKDVASVRISDQEVFIKYKNQEFGFTKDEKKVKGSEKTLKSPCRVIAQEFFLPMDAFSEILKIAVQWDGSQRQIILDELSLPSAVLDVDFYEEGNKAVFVVNHQGPIKYNIEETSKGNWKLEIEESSLSKPIPWLIIEHPLLHSVRVEQLSRNKVTMHIRGNQDGILESSVQGSKLIIEFYYSVDSFEYFNLGGLPLLKAQSLGSLPEPKEYVNENSQLIREFQGVKLTGRPVKTVVNDGLSESFEYYQKGDKVITQLQLKPAVASLFKTSIGTLRLAQLKKVITSENNLGTVLEFNFVGEPIVKADQNRNILTLDFRDTDGRSLLQEIKKTPQLQEAIFTQIDEETLRVHLTLQNTKGYAVLKKDANTFLVQLVKSDLKEVLIVIDPGHGGHDPGAVGSKTTEKEITLDIATRLSVLFQQAGYSTILTRDADVYVSLSDRTDISLKSDADIFVSIHVNGSTNLEAMGIETYHVSGARNAKDLAQYVQKSLIETTKAIDRGVRQADFWVLQNNVPLSILVETGFITNSIEEEKLIDSRYRQNIAESIFVGIERYLMNHIR